MTTKRRSANDGPAERLTFWAAEISDRTALDVSVKRSEYRHKTWRGWRPVPGSWFDVIVRESASAATISGPMRFSEAWGYLSGLRVGARTAAAKGYGGDETAGEERA